RRPGCPPPAAGARAMTLVNGTLPFQDAAPPAPAGAAPAVTTVAASTASAAASRFIWILPPPPRALLYHQWRPRPSNRTPTGVPGPEISRDPGSVADLHTLVEPPSRAAAALSCLAGRCHGRPVGIACIVQRP